MNIFSTTNKNIASELMPHQARLVRHLLQSPPPLRILLVADPGTGKTTAALFTVREIVNQKADYKILVLGPASLVSMYQNQFGEVVQEKEATIIDRRVLRELENGTPKGQAIWPCPFLGIISENLAKHEDIFKHLCSVDWDIVIVDEAHRYKGLKEKLLINIISNDAFHKVLLITATPDVNETLQKQKNIEKIIWTRSELHDWNGRALFKNINAKLSEITYSRDEDEITTLHELKKLIKEIPNNTHNEIIINYLLRQASSSTFALEYSLRQLRNTCSHAHGDISFLFKPTSAPEDLVPTEIEFKEYFLTLITSSASWKIESRTMSIFNNLINSFELLQSDNKLSTLESILEHIIPDRKTENRRTVISCATKETTRYIQTALSQLGYRSLSLLIHNTSDDIQKSLEWFKSKGNILVCMAEICNGIEFNNIDNFIYYDPPETASNFEALILQNPGAAHFIIKDNSGLLPDEWENVKPYQIFAKLGII